MSAKKEQFQERASDDDVSSYQHQGGNAMTRKTTKKAAEADDRKTTPKTREAAPMDPRVSEQAVGVEHKNHPRTSLALKTLVSEVHNLFPETPVEYSGVDGRNTSLAVTFDLTTLDGFDRERLVSVFGILDSDRRVAEVICEDDHVLVSLVSSSRTQDDPTPFGFEEAWTIISDDEEQEREG